MSNNRIPAQPHRAPHHPDCGRALAISLFILVLTASCGISPTLPPPAPPGIQQYGLPTAGRYRDVVIVDMDRDGILDIVGGASSPGKVAIWYRDHRAAYSKPRFLDIKGDVRSLAAGDLNGDGLPDIVFSVQKEASGIMVWLNGPDRSWRRGTSPVEGNLYEGLDLVDINSDGHLDIVAANATAGAGGGIQVFLGDGTGSWGTESGPTVSGFYMDVATADFNRDGNIDIAGSGWGVEGGVRIWLGNGAGGWTPRPLLDPNTSFYALTVTDFNGDGKPDLLAGTFQSGVRIFTADGTGNYRPYPSPTQNGDYWQVLATDLNGDGFNEVLASSPDGSGISAWRRADPSGWVLIKGIYPAKGVYYALAIADLNDNGRQDLCAANFGEGIHLWMERGGYLSTGRDRDDPSGADGPDSPMSPQPRRVEKNEVFTTASGSPEYKIGPGDTLEITLWKGTTGTTEDILVRPDGRISFGFVEDLKVTGITANQLDEILTRDLMQYIKYPRIDVIVKTYESKFVTFVGEVYTNINFRSGPGKYELTGKVTLLEMLSQIGGPTKDANLREVRVRNRNGQSFTVDLYRAINYGDTSQNAILDSGDLVMIPAITKEANRVYVFGEVTKPGVYTFTGSEMRLFDAIAEAGGVTIFATPAATRIVRGDITRPEVIPVNLARLIERGDRTQDVALRDRDLVYVPRSFVGDVNVFVKRISPLLNLIFAPARFRDEYLEGGDLRWP